MDNVGVAIMIDQLTAQVLEGVAESWSMSVSELCTLLLMRDAQNMAHWPGNLGSSLRQRLLRVIYPPTDTGQLPLDWGSDIST